MILPFRSARAGRKSLRKGGKKIDILIRYAQTAEVTSNLRLSLLIVDRKRTASGVRRKKSALKRCARTWILALTASADPHAEWLECDHRLSYAAARRLAIQTFVRKYDPSGGREAILRKICAETGLYLCGGKHPESERLLEPNYLKRGLPSVTSKCVGELGR